jgi:hypothetical protein
MFFTSFVRFLELGQRIQHSVWKRMVGAFSAFFELLRADAVLHLPED